MTVMALSDTTSMWFLSVGLVIGIAVIVAVLLAMVLSLLGDVRERLRELVTAANKLFGGAPPSERLREAIDVSERQRRGISRRSRTAGSGS